jgi:hypothetical protein
MAQAAQATKAAKPGAADAAPRAVGAARAPSAGSAGQPPAGTNLPPVLTPEDFARIGQTLNGKHWQADIAALIGCSKSQVTRYLKKSPDPRNHRDLNPLTAKHLQFVIVERIRDLVQCLNVPGMPYAGSAETLVAVGEIDRVLTPIAGQEPPRDD